MPEVLRPAAVLFEWDMLENFNASSNTCDYTKVTDRNGNSCRLFEWKDATMVWLYHGKHLAVSPSR